MLDGAERRRIVDIHRRLLFPFSGISFRVSGFGFHSLESTFRVSLSGFHFSGFSFRISLSGIEFRAAGVGFRVRGFGFSYQFENNYFTEMCSGSEAGSYLRLIDFVYHSTLGLRVIKKREV